MECIGSGLCSEVDRPTCEMSKLRSQIVCLYTELLDCILCGDERRQVAVHRVDRSAIDVCGALVRLAAGDLVVAPGERIRAGRCGARLASRDYARHERDEAEHVAAVQRHFQHLPGLDHVTEGRVFGLQERRLRRDFDYLADVAHLHRNIDADGALHFNRDGLPRKAAESGLFHFDFILTGYEVYELIASRIICLRSAAVRCTEISECYVCLTDSTRPGVRDRTDNRSIEGLSERCGVCEQTSQSQHCSNLHVFPLLPGRGLRRLYT